ncbi:MAG TPA: hypothetical protein PLL21_05735, partial [Sedimentibacter sp.]|nr:hypothetical protein [Sedimentibacter sp.]
RMMTKLFYFTNDGKKQFNNSLIRFDDYPEFVDNYNYQNEESESEIVKEAILKRFKALLQKAIEDNHPLSKNYSPAEKTVKERRILYMRYAIEYVENYQLENILGLNEYISNKMNASDYHIERLSRYFFGRGSTPESSNMKTAKSDKKERVPSLINDDFCPNTPQPIVSQKRKFQRKLNLEYFYY